MRNEPRTASVAIALAVISSLAACSLVTAPPAPPITTPRASTETEYQRRPYTWPPGARLVYTSAEYTERESAGRTEPAGGKTHTLILTAAPTGACQQE